MSKFPRTVTRYMKKNKQTMTGCSPGSSVNPRRRNPGNAVWFLFCMLLINLIEVVISEKSLHQKQQSHLKCHQNTTPEVWRQVQCLKHLLHKHESQSSDLQNPTYRPGFCSSQPVIQFQMPLSVCPWEMKISFMSKVLIMKNLYLIKLYKRDHHRLSPSMSLGNLKFKALHQTDICSNIFTP